MSTKSSLTLIRTIPDFPTLQRLASVLWKQENSYHGAAVMVGAGFSRCSAITGDRTKKLPLWFNFSDILRKELETDGTDPLRIAEEYSAYFGRQSLNDLIKKEINDFSWEPSDSHRSLLQLPWTEVLTTNWDTLLERASEKIHERFYSVVYRQEDLSNARSPRIVKLHGTVNVTNDLTFTQEDYRTYPENQAAFVNFARQVFIENELCLIGFSGDDPNFLQWTGWVRDHLSTNARRIYLVGALGLTAAKRKYLESINIAPIDLEVLVSKYDNIDLKHQKATEIFLSALKELKPEPCWEWLPSSIDYKVDIERKLSVLKKDREEFPGWVVCPIHIRSRLIIEHYVHSISNQETLSNLKEDIRVELLYEVAWRRRLTYEATPQWLLQEMLKVCNPSQPNTLTKKQQLEIALHILESSRWLDESKSNAFESEVASIIRAHSIYLPESEFEISFNLAEKALKKLQYKELEKFVNDLVPTEPIQKLRKALLLGELGKYAEGKELIINAHSELLSQFRNNSDSIYLLSRLLIADHIVNSVELRFKDNKFVENEREKFCDVWAQFDYLRNKLRSWIEKQNESQGIQVLFEPGAYRDKSQTKIYNNGVHPLLVFKGLSYSAGIPMAWDNVSFMVDIASKLATLDELDNEERFSLAIRAANSETDEVIEQTFSRLKMASITEEESAELISKCESAIKYWLSKLSNNSVGRDSKVLTRLRVLIEVLARVSIRATPDKARQLFNLALELGDKKELQHFWLFKSLNHLIEYSLKSIPESQHHLLLNKALRFPLATELELNSFQYDWPNPIIKSVGERKGDASVDVRISEIIGHITPNSPSSSYALERLIPLIDSGFLRTAEIDEIATQIWGENEELRTLPDTGLLNWVLLKLPSNDRGKVVNLVRQYLYHAKEEQLFDTNRIYDLISAAQADHIRELPTGSEAKAYFDSFVKWRPHIEEEQHLRALRQEETNGALIAEVISRAIVPALSRNDLVRENFNKLVSFFDDTKIPQVILALPNFAGNSSEIDKSLEKIIRNCLLDSNSQVVGQASFALLRWCELDPSTATGRLLALMISIINHNRAPAMANLLWTANQMLIKGYLNETEVNTLSESIPRVFDSTGYRSSSRTELESVSISLLRAECVRLAINIVDSQDCSIEDDTHLNRVIIEAKTDPLPEVRFAANPNLE